MEKFTYIVDAVIYSAKMNLLCMNPDEAIKDPKIKKAMRLTVSRMLHDEIYNQKYSKSLTPKQ